MPPLGTGTPNQASGLTDAQARTIIQAAQVALHSIYGRDQKTANRLYNDLENWARTGKKPLFGSNPSPARFVNDANAILASLNAKGGQDAADADAIRAVLNLPASQVIHLGGFAPASVNPATVSQSFTKSAAATVNSATPLGPLFNAHIWIRVGEVAIGLILIAVGVAKLTNAVPVATKIARYVA